MTDAHFELLSGLGDCTFVYLWEDNDHITEAIYFEFHEYILN